MDYSVKETIKYFKEMKIDVRQGTVEAFRAKLQEAGIISNNQPMTEKHIKAFEKVVREKTDNDKWETLMNKVIYTDLRSDINFEFKWTPHIIFTHLTNAIKDGYYSIEHMTARYGTEDWMIMCDCIDNFVELGRKDFLYEGSSGCDVNGVILFKVKTPNNCCYYIIGKRNPITSEEDVHIFYNPYPHFEIMQCKHIASERFEADIVANLWHVCCETIRKEKE